MLCFYFASHERERQTARSCPLKQQTALNIVDMDVMLRHVLYFISDVCSVNSKHFFYDFDQLL